MTAIWTNKDFRNLGEPEQRMYLLLVTQSDISAAGVLPLRLRRWADMSSSSAASSLADALKALEAGRFIVVDWDAEELLIRSFIRWDGGANNPKRRPVIIRAAAEVVSPEIARHLATEFVRCGIAPPEPPPDKPSGKVPDRHADSLSAQSESPAATTLPKNPFPQVNSLSDRHAAEDGVVVTYLSSSDTTTRNPQPATLPPPAGATPTTAQTAVAEWIDAFRATGNQPLPRQIKQAGKEAKDLIDAGNDPARVLAFARSAGSKCRATIANELAVVATRTTGQSSRPTADDKIAALQRLKTGTDGGPNLYSIER